MSKKRIVQLSIVACIALAMFFVLSASAQDQAQRNSGVDLLNLPWSQIAAMIGVVSAIFGVIQWILTVQLIQPQIRNAVTSSSSDVRAWASKEFTLRSKYDLHLLEDKQAHERVNGQIADVVHDISTVGERVAGLHDKVILNAQVIVQHDQRIGRIERRRERSDDTQD